MTMVFGEMGGGMQIEWQGTIDVSPAPEAVYAYLADFRRHGEWATSLVRVTQTGAGNPDGVGARFEAVERASDPVGDGWRGRIPRRREAKSVCEVTELVPGKRIAWVAHPKPKVGGARIRFDLLPTIDGGTRIVQTVEERYPLPAALVLRYAFGMGEPEVVRMFDASLETLRVTIERRFGSMGAGGDVVHLGGMRAPGNDGQGGKGKSGNRKWEII